MQPAAQTSPSLGRQQSVGPVAVEDGSIRVRRRGTKMGGYQLMIAADIFRGRYRESFEKPQDLKPNVALTYQFALPTANHVFLSGHRLMVQIQSTWFPRYDRNPQKFVPNIFPAQPGDHQKATQRIYHPAMPAVSAFLWFSTK